MSEQRRGRGRRSSITDPNSAELVKYGTNALLALNPSRGAWWPVARIRLWWPGGLSGAVRTRRETLPVQATKGRI